ncbi:MAG: hypothetical protein F2790_05970 [Actinobacteria bacterium]|nr:hypothetical protein [Actinomycetota bacterium]
MSIFPPQPRAHEHDSPAPDMSDRRILFSIHSWADDVQHDALLSSALPSWQIESIARAPLDPTLTPRQRLERWITTASTSITNAQPTGPLSLIGFSLGGRMAYVIANDLRKQGRTIAYCGVIDMVGEWPSIRPSSLRRLAALMRDVPTIASWWNLIRRGPISRIRWRLKWGLARCIPHSRRVPLLAGNPNGEVARYLNHSVRATWQLVSILRLSESTIPITLFATQSSVTLYKSPDLLWSPIVGRPINVIAIPGNHTTVFDVEHFDSLARAIEKSLPSASG